MSDGRSLVEFQKKFPNEKSCAEFLFKRRWPDGFFCPACGSLRAVELRSRAYTYECRDCRRQTSITAGTIMHRTRLPLTKWFWAAHLMATHSNGISALQLRAQIGVNYKTAWLLETKLRRCMVDPHREPLEGVVEIDQTEIPYRNTDTFFDPLRSGKITIVGAVELVDNYTQEPVRPRPLGARYLDIRSGRIRLGMVPNNSTQAISAFVNAEIAKGTTLVSDGHRSYPPIVGYRHDPRTVGKAAGHVMLPKIHQVFALLKRWGLGTYHGLRLAHIDEYLNEFTFRYNRRYYRHVSFERMLGLGAAHPPQSYWDLIGRDNPRLGRTAKRKQPRRRKTDFGMRRDRTAKIPSPDVAPELNNPLPTPSEKPPETGDSERPQ